VQIARVFCHPAVRVPYRDGPDALVSLAQQRNFIQPATAGPVAGDVE